MSNPNVEVAFNLAAIVVPAAVAVATFVMGANSPEMLGNPSVGEILTVAGTALAGSFIGFANAVGGIGSDINAVRDLTGKKRSNSRRFGL